MNYQTKSSGSAVLEACGTAPTVEPWMTAAVDVDADSDRVDHWDDEEDIGPPLTEDERQRILKDPEFIAWRDGIYRSLEEADAAEAAGHVRSHEESMREFWWKVENGLL